MPTETIHASAVLKAKPETLYEAWLDGDSHAAMTGGAATSEPRVGNRFSAWGGYITGLAENMEFILTPAVIVVGRLQQGFVARASRTLHYMPAVDLILAPEEEFARKLNVLP